jgi:hypothetical protein
VADGFPDDLRVVVLNKNPFTITRTYDNKPYEYKSAKPLTVAPEVAWFHWAFDTRLNPAQRSHHGGQDHRGTPWYQNILISLGWAEDDWTPPMISEKQYERMIKNGTWHDAETKKAWFENIDFKVIGANTVRNAKEFAELPV